MHNQAWVRGDYSDVVVRLSAVYAALRNDRATRDAADGDGNQSFLRSTTKYWVRTEDVSKVKYAILKHLPVFLQKTSTGESDSQLTNSVYFDNDQLGECPRRPWRHTTRQIAEEEVMAAPSSMCVWRCNKRAPFFNASFFLTSQICRALPRSA